MGTVPTGKTEQMMTFQEMHGVVERLLYDMGADVNGPLIKNRIAAFESIIENCKFYTKSFKDLSSGE